MNSWYAIAVFLHVLAALGLFFALGLEHVALARMRRATTVLQVREWAAVLKPLGPLYGIVSVSLLVSGGVMVFAVWGWGQAWILLSLGTLIAISAAGPLVNGRRTDAIAADAVAAPEGVIPAALTRRIADPVLIASTQITAGISVWVVLLMTLKPDLVIALPALAVAVALSAVSAMRVQRRMPSTPDTAPRLTT